MRTTPEAIDLQATFRAMLDAGDRACAMEVSSHALELRRVDGDPLRRRRVHEPQPGPPRLPSRHGGLLRGEGRGCSTEFDVGRADRGRRRRRGAGGSPTALDDAVTVSLEGRPTGRRSSLRADLGGNAFTVRSPAGEAAVELPLRGRFNAANALVALAAGDALGLELDADGRGAADGHAGAGARAGGRRGQGSRCSSTTRTSPGALEKVLRSARELATGPRARRVRRRRRPRPRQAAADGRDRRAAGGPS